MPVLANSCEVNIISWRSILTTPSTLVSCERLDMGNNSISDSLQLYLSGVIKSG